MKSRFETGVLVSEELHGIWNIWKLERLCIYRMVFFDARWEARRLLEARRKYGHPSPLNDSS
jgi:hypothetical protein